jgi:hypothetical protein
VPWPATLRVGMDAPRAALTNVAGAFLVPFSGLDLTELVVYLSWTDDVLVVGPPFRIPALVTRRITVTRPQGPVAAAVSEVPGRLARSG